MNKNIQNHQLPLPLGEGWGEGAHFAMAGCVKLGTALCGNMPRPCHALNGRLSDNSQRTSGKSQPRSNKIVVRSGRQGRNPTHDYPKIWRALSAKLTRAKNIREAVSPESGILLCTRKNHELVEYALAGMSNNLFVSRYQVQLPGKKEMVAFLHKAVEELGGGDE